MPAEGTTIRIIHIIVAIKYYCFLFKFTILNNTLFLPLEINVKSYK